MRRHVLLALGVAASLALAGNLLAQGTPVQVPPGTPTSTVTGTVVSSSGSEIVLDTTSGRQRYIVDANSTVPAELQAGTRVSVEFHRLDGDRMHVARVTTAAPSAVPPRAGAASPNEKVPAVSTETARAERETARADRDAARDRDARDRDARDRDAGRSKDPSLPHTASPLPLVALIAAATLAGSAALRLADRDR